MNNLTVKYIGHDPDITELVYGKTYAVRRIDMGRWYTSVYLVDFPNPYNSILFSFYEDGKEIDIFKDKRFNMYLQ